MLSRDPRSARKSFQSEHLCHSGIFESFICSFPALGLVPGNAVSNWFGFFGFFFGRDLSAFIPEDFPLQVPRGMCSPGHVMRNGSAYFVVLWGGGATQVMQQCL